MGCIGRRSPGRRGGRGAPSSWCSLRDADAEKSAGRELGGRAQDELFPGLQREQWARQDAAAELCTRDADRSAERSCAGRRLRRTRRNRGAAGRGAAGVTCGACRRQLHGRRSWRGRCNWSRRRGRSSRSRRSGQRRCGWRNRRASQLSGGATGRRTAQAVNRGAAAGARRRRRRRGWPRRLPAARLPASPQPEEARPGAAEAEPPQLPSFA